MKLIKQEIIMQNDEKTMQSMVKSSEIQPYQFDTVEDYIGKLIRCHGYEMHLNPGKLLPLLRQTAKKYWKDAKKNH